MKTGRGAWKELRCSCLLMLLTHFFEVFVVTVIGRGVQGTICTSSSTANVVNWGGLNSAVVIAHEVFHK
jgi:hypothetical protein